MRQPLLHTFTKQRFYPYLHSNIANSPMQCERYGQVAMCDPDRIAHKEPTMRQRPLGTRALTERSTSHSAARRICLPAISPDSKQTRS